jgi:TetR/AcrR family transcriptional regulator
MKKEEVILTHDESSARQRLIAAAGPLFAEHGIDGVSIRDIAKASNLNLSLISYYFGGKEGLYKAVITDFVMRANSEFYKQMAGFDTENFSKEVFAQKMHRIIEAMVEIKLRAPHIAKIMQREVLSGLPHAKDIYENTLNDLSQKIVGILLKAQKKGILKKEIHVHLLFISMAHAVDCFFIASQCKAGIMDYMPKLPQESAQYSNHLYKIFIEGALV